MSILSNIFKKIAVSIDGTSNKVSSTRIQSYVMLSLVVASAVAFIAIEIWNAAMSWSCDKPYAISNEIIIVFGMLLSHHIGILFNRNRAKAEQNQIPIIPGDQDKGITVQPPAGMDPANPPTP